MTHYPDETRLREWGEKLAATDWRALTDAVIAYAHRDDQVDTPDGFPRSTLGDGSRGRGGSSTEAGAIALLDERADEFHDHVQNLVVYFMDAAQARNNAISRRRKLDTMSMLQRPPGHTASPCAEPHCDDLADGGRDGRCEACYRWRVRWADKRGRSKTEAPIVPRSVIDERRRARENRKVHVNGPLAQHHGDGADIVERLNPGHVTGT